MKNLGQVKEFKSSPKLLEQLKEFGMVKVFEEGEVLVNENSRIFSIPIVLNGTLKVIRTDEDGKEILLYYIKPGESCIMSFLGGLHQDTSKVKAVIEEKSEVLFLPMEKVHYFIKEYPQWLEYIFRLYHQRFEELLEVVNGIAFKKVDERLWDLLLKKVDLGGSKNLYTTHEQLANELGTARVVVSRLLKQLEERGSVELGRNKIKIIS